MTSKLTRERLQEIAEDGFLKHGESKELARMALAAMDIEPVILYRQVNPTNGMKTYWAELDPEEFRHLKKYTDENAEFMTLYRHTQPVPVVNYVPLGDSPYDVPYSMPSNLREFIDQEIGILFSDDDAQGVWIACRRAAMLQAAPVCTCPSGDGSLRWPCPVHPGNCPVIPDGWKMVPIDATRAMIDAARRVEEDGYDAMHKAMLAVAPQPQNAPQNIPEIIPNELIAAVNRLLDSNGSRGCYNAIKCYDAHIEVERLLAAARQEDANALISVVSRDEQEGK